MLLCLVSRRGEGWGKEVYSWEGINIAMAIAIAREVAIAMTEYSHCTAEPASTYWYTALHSVQVSHGGCYARNKQRFHQSNVLLHENGDVYKGNAPSIGALQAISPCPRLMRSMLH